MLKESLEGIRFVHRLIIGAVAATIVFALTPDQRKLTNTQLRELAVLQEAIADYDGFTDALWKANKDNHEQYDFLERVQAGLAQRDILPGEIKNRHRISQRNRSSTRITGFADHFKGESLAVIAGHLDRRYRLFVADMEDFQEKLDNSGINEWPPVPYSELTVSYEGSNIINDGWDEKGEYDRSEVLWTCDISITQNDAAGESKTRTVEVTFRARAQPLPYDSWAAWLSTRANSREITQKTGGQLVSLPHLRREWQSLEKLKIIEAKSRLNERLSEKKDSLQFFGIAIAPDSAALISPLALLAALLYFTGHVRHCMETVDDEGEILRKFPWMGLFSGIIGPALTYFSLIIGPAMAFALLAIRVEFQNTPLYWSAAGLALLTILAGIYAAFNVYRLRKLKIRLNATLAGEERTETPPPLPDRI